MLSAAQADGKFRLDRDTISRLRTRNTAGDMVQLGSVVDYREEIGTNRYPRYDLYPAAEINGDTVPGFTSGSIHTVRLHFAETYFSTSGSRVFNVSINGTRVLTNFDIVAASGGKDVAIVCLPGEVFVDLGLAIKRGSPFPTTLVIELADAVETMYIPTRGAYAGGVRCRRASIRPAGSRRRSRGSSTSRGARPGRDRRRTGRAARRGPRRPRARHGGWKSE